MKKLLVLIALCLCFSLLLVACGDDTADSQPNDSKNSVTSSSTTEDSGNKTDDSSTKDSGSGNGTGDSGNGNGTGDSGNGNGGGSNTGDSQKPEHTHVFGEWVKVNDPTCTEEGLKKRECECGASETQPIATISHTEEAVNGKAPTCTETGLTDGVKCSECGYIIVKQETIPASHTPEVVPGYAQTCTEDGLTDGLCCSICGETIVEQQPIPASHTLEILPAVEPTCYNWGLTEGSYCSACDEPIVTQELIPPKHVPGVYEGSSPVDCFTPGYKDGVKCTLCGTVIEEREEIPPYHLDVKVVLGKIATCTETGLTDGLKCEACGTTVKEQDVIPYSLHNFVDGKCTHCVIDEFSQGLAYSLSDDGEYYILTGRGTCKDYKVIIPESYMGKPVKEIARYAFQSDYNIISLVIPSTIEAIASNAFDHALRLIEVYNLSTHLNFNSTTDQTGIAAVAQVINSQLDVPSILKQSGDFLFAEINTPKLMAYLGNDVEVVLPDNYNGGKYEIYDYAFNGHYNIVSMVVPNAVTKVGLGSFYSCVSLVELYYLAGLQLEFNGSWMQGELGRYALVINSSMDPESIINIVDDFVFVTVDGENYLVRYIGDKTSIVLPDSYNGESYSIYNRAFNFSSLEHITLSDGVTAIGDYAFENCSNLKEVIIGKNVTTIGKLAFSYSGIRKIVIPDSVVSLGDNVFLQCTSLACVVLGNGIETIAPNAFAYCPNLVSITLPKSLKSIGANAFGNSNTNGIERLKEIINHSDIVLKIGNEDNGFIAYRAMVIKTGDDDTASIVIKDDFAFVLVDGEYYLAAYLGNDKEITLPSDINGCTYAIAKYTFRDRTLLYHVTIPEGVTAIGDYAFDSCTHLTTIKIAGSVKSIGNYAFRWCSMLESITLSEGINTIGKYTFYSCTSLTSVVLPKSLTAIGYYAFSKCANIKSIEFGSPNNWYTTTTEGATSGRDQDPLTDAEKNASNLVASKSHWYKKSK